MIVIRSVKKMREYSLGTRARGKRIGFVPTMGYLHHGHESLLKKARSQNDAVVLSIYVNPTQFGPKEDLAKYPRDIRRDMAAAGRNGVDCVFIPSDKEMYPAGDSTFVDVRGLGDNLCGRFRPGHFRGVATVVAKLFNIVMPHTAYFGQKDAQQAVIIKRLALDMCAGVDVRVLPTVRESDGLAASSRNVYLSKSERKDALCLIRSIRLARRMVKAGIRNTAKITDEIKKVIDGTPSARVQYINIVDPGTLADVATIRGKALLAMAVFIGKTRLIDNTMLGDVRE